MTESASCGYDSGVDCCERPVADEARDVDAINLELDPTTISENTNNGNPVSISYDNVACNSIKPEVGNALETVVPRQKSATENTRQINPIRRKKRRHLLTVRRRKNRSRNIPMSGEQTADTCEQTASAREQTFERNGAAFDGDFQGMATDLSFDLGDQHSNVEFRVNNTASLDMVTQSKIVNITDDVIDDNLHVTDECEQIVIDSDQDTTMYLEDSADAVYEVHHVLGEINRKTNEDTNVDECEMLRASHVLF